MKIDHTCPMFDEQCQSDTTNEDESFSIPLCMDDIISICRDYSSLGWQIQNQIENILEIGVEQSVTSGNVKLESLPRVKYFLQKIVSNVYFGDAASQAQDCLALIQEYEDKYKIRYTSKSN
jgi:hypothetical protein